MQNQSTEIKVVGQGQQIQIGGTKLVYASPGPELTKAGKKKLGPGTVNTNWGPGPGPGARVQAEGWGLEIQIPPSHIPTCHNFI